MLDKIHFTLNGIIDLDHFTLLSALEDCGDHGGAPAGPVLGEHQVELVVGPHQLEIIQYNMYMYNLYNYIV